MIKKEQFKDVVKYSLGLIGKSQLSLKKNYFSEIKFITERKKWSIYMDGKYISNNINLSQKKNIVNVSNKPYLYSNKIIHFGSQYMWTDWVDHLSKNNLYIATFYHGKFEDDKHVHDHINKFIDTSNKLKKIITSSTLVENRLLKWGISRKKLIKIPIGVDVSLFSPTTISNKQKIKLKLGIKKNSLVIGSFQKDGNGWGQGKEPKLIKGPDLFIDAVSKIAKHYPVTVLLTGPSRGYVKSELTKKNIKYVHLYLNSIQEVAKCYQALDIYLVTSREEGGPKSILESMASGIPLVSTNVGMASDLIISGKNGYISKKNGTDIAEKAIELINNVNLNDILKNARQSVQSIDWKYVSSEHWNKIYKPLIDTYK